MKQSDVLLSIPHKLVLEVVELFCKQRGINHLTSAPYHTASNGLAENLVKTLKTSLKKLYGEGNTDQILRKLIFYFLRTPYYDLRDQTPSQLMNRREKWTNLDLVKPPTVQTTTQNSEMTQQFDKHHGAVARIWRRRRSSREAPLQQQQVALGTDNDQKRLGAVIFEVQVNNRIVQFHAN